MKLLAKVLRWEAMIYGSILRWIFRRPALPEGATPFAYVGAVGVVMWGFIIASAMELVALHLILHGAWRLAADIVSVWGLVWMVGLLACHTMRPHFATGSELVIRRGLGAPIVVPWSAVASVGTRERWRESTRSMNLDGTVLHLAGRTNVDIMLREPLVVPVPKVGDSAVTEIRFFADDPKALVTHGRSALVPAA